MIKLKALLGILLYSLIALLAVACTTTPPESQKGSHRVAEEFVKMESTCRFDGVLESFKLTSTTSVANGWKFTIEYDSQHAGYGNRTGQVLAQVITHHVAVVVVEGGRVESAIMDDRWDMISQRIAEAASSSEGFAVYLLSKDVPVSQMSLVNHLELADTPLISLKDIVSYNGATHELELSPTAVESLLNLDVPTSGKVFVVCVDRQPIYWGAFWTPISSQSFDGVTILKPLSPERRTIRIEMGYPPGGSPRGADPRYDPSVMQSLQQADKLK